MKVTSNPIRTPDSGPRGPAATHGPEAEALLDEVRDAIGTLAKLLSHGGELGEPVALAIRGALDEVSGKLDRRELRVVVVGEERSGKSTFLDALLGERLLGMAKTPPNTVTTIRCRPELGYRARLADGFIDDFAVRMPDRSAALMTDLASAETKLLDAKRRSVAGAVEVAACADALERVQTSMTDAFRAFEEARAEAELCGVKLQAKQKDWGKLCGDATERANALPALVRRPPPPWWAIWLWVMLVVALLLHWRGWRRHREMLSDCAKGEGEVDELRAASSRAAERCSEAEAALANVNLPVEEARRALEATRRAQGEAEAACAAVEHEIAEKRRELENEQSQRRRRFAADVMALSNLEDRGKDVVDLEIDYPARLLPEDIALIEAPGITSGNARSNERAWRAIRERADACIVVSELERAVSGDTQKFLHPLRDAVPHAILVLTKMDETRSAAQHKGDGDPAQQVERARRIGARRFAREMGRDPDTVLSVTVAAEETLRDAPSSEPDRRRFEADVATLFTLLRYERALILGASSAAIVRRCIRDLSDAGARAALAHRDRIAALEAKRIPNPDQFYAEQMTAAEPAIAESAKSAVASAASVLRDSADLGRVACKAKIEACKTKEDLKRLAPELTSVMLTALNLAREEARTKVNERAEQGVRDIEKGIFQALKERYYILHEVTRPADLRLVVAPPIAPTFKAADLARQLDGATRSFDRFRIGFGVGGAAVGAGIGTLVLPGIGSVAGALVGGLATFAKTLGALKREFAATADEHGADLERLLGEQVAALEPAVTTTIRASLAKSLEQVLARFARFIDEPIQEERAAIENEREKVSDLESLQDRLQKHDDRLEALIQRATDASIGLCR